MDDEFLPKLSQNLLEILNDDQYYDITIEVGNDPYVKIFRAHMVILNYRSPYIRRILSTYKKKNDGTLVQIKLPNTLPETFQIILRYIYGGRLSLEECDASDIVKILVTASELSLQELITHLQSFLIKNKANWMEQNFSLIYRTSFKNNSFLELQKFCTELMSREPEKIFKSPDFTSISENSLISLIQHDSLQMSEIQIWEHVLKWGIAQNPELSSDPEGYSKGDFNALKNTLQQCIPFIRFHNLTSKEFSKILPYRKILPKELYMDLLNDFLDNDFKPRKKSELRVAKEIRNYDEKNKDKVEIVKLEGSDFSEAVEVKGRIPNELPEPICEAKEIIRISNELPEPTCEAKEIIHSKNIDSKIITFQHAELISKWIDVRLTSSYKFKLLFRGSRDGYTPEKFHEICDNQYHTVSIIKVKNSNEILGGYNPIGWKSSGVCQETKDSFIFSFKNSDGIENYILSRVKDKERAIFDWRSYGPSFGNGDLILMGGGFYRISSCKRNSYERPIRETRDTFSVEEYEVFQIDV